MKYLAPLVTITSLVLSSSFAQSADLAARFPAKALPMSSPIFSWTGFYVGVNAGYNWGDQATDYNYRILDPSPADEAVLPSRLSASHGGFTGGGQAGYNLQVGNIVYGLEADIQYLGGKSDASASFAEVDGADSANVRMTARSSVEWLGTVRGRVGYASDRTLVYATGGLAYGGVKSDTRIAVNVVDGGVASSALIAGGKNETRVGYAVGGGVEYALTQNITIKGEYLYYDLGKIDYDVTPAVIDPDDEFLGAGAKRHADGNIVRVGLNVKL